MISVIIPLYNAEKSITKTLDSIKNQTWTGQFEIISINDGSTDNSRQIVDDYIKENQTLNIYLLNQENAGVSSARNAGLKIAKGEYIALLDADDEWLPEKTLQQMKFLEDKNFKIDFLAARRNNHQISYPYKVNQNHLAPISFRLLLIRNEAQPSTVIFKRNVLDNTGFFDENQKYAEDLNYWLRVSENNKMYILDVELILFGAGKRTFGSSGLSSNLQEMEKGFQKNLKEMLHLKRINSIEYFFYYIFYKMKYVLRISRNKLLKAKGK